MNRLKELRQKRGLSQIELAEILHLAQTTISAYENGTRDLDAQTLKQLSEFFDVSVDYLIENSKIYASSFPTRLKELRQSREITQSDLADILNVGSNTISQYETGNREPCFASLLRISEYFGVSVDYLLGISEFHDQPPVERMFFGDHLKKCRSNAGLSQKTLAKLLGISQQAVGSWETGRTSPSPEMIAEIASVLKVSADVLLGLKETDASDCTMHEPDSAYPRSIDISRQIDEIISDLRNSESVVVFNDEFLDNDTRSLLVSLMESSKRMIAIISKRK